MTNNVSSSSTGIGFFGLLFLALLIMKLANIGMVANWSWWLVTAPLWIPGAIILFILLIVFIIFMIGK